MYNFIIYLLDEKEIKFENNYISKLSLFNMLNDKNDYIEIEEYIIPKVEIKCIKYLKEEKNGENQ